MNCIDTPQQILRIESNKNNEFAKKKRENDSLNSSLEVTIKRKEDSFFQAIYEKCVFSAHRNIIQSRKCA